MIKAAEPVATDFEDLPERSQLTTHYKGDFSVAYLSQFLKCMERNSLIIRLCQDKPLLMQYPLGLENFVRFILAPKMDSES